MEDFSKKKIFGIILKFWMRTFDYSYFITVIFLFDNVLNKVMIEFIIISIYREWLKIVFL